MNNPTPPNFRQRMYLPNEFKITVWSKMRPYFHELLRRDIQSAKDLEKWILDQNELAQVIQEEFDSRKNNHFIHQTEDERAAELYEYAVQELFPKITPTEKLLAKMSIGDSLSMLILVDSLEQLPMGFEGGDYMEVILKAFKKTSKDDREKDNKTALIGLKKHPNGRFYWKKHISKTGVFPRPNDQVELYFQLRKGNDIFYQTASNKPDIITLPVEGTDVSPLHQVLQQMVVGDSVTAAFEIASMSKDIQASMIQSGFFAGDIMTIDVSLLTLKDSLTLAKEQAEIKKQQEAELAATKSFGKRLEQLIPQKIQDYKDGKLQTIRTPSGLKYVIHEKGKGPILENHQTAFVHYIGFLTNQKTKFDSSFDRGKSFNFEVGGKEVINGWEEAIRLLPVGTKATLFVPYHLGYGETGSKVIPPYANLTFYIEVVGGR